MPYRNRNRFRTLSRAWPGGILVCILLGLLALAPALPASPGDSQAPTDSPRADSPCAGARRGGGSGQGGCDCGQGGPGDGSRGGPGTGKAEGCGGKGAHDDGGEHGGRPEAKLAHFLIDNHDRLRREVERIEGGVRTRTTTTDPTLIEPLREHVRQMLTLIEEGGRIRNWDPLFREIFEHRDAIEMQFTDIEGGIEVVETSADEEVTKLIQAHADKVGQFVTRGSEAYQEATDLPAGYRDSSP